MNLHDKNDIDICVWWVGHHSGGGFKSLYVLYEEGDVYRIIQEQESDIFEAIQQQRIIESSSFVEKRDSEFDDNEILNLLESISFSIYSGPDHNGLSANKYGIKLSIGDRSASFEWLGKQDSFDDKVVKLFQYVREL